MTRPPTIASALAPALAAALLLAGGARTAAHAAEPAAGWHRDVADAMAEAAAAERPILVDLYAAWCGWCKRLDRETFADPAFTAWAAGRVVLLRVDVEDGGEGSRLKERFGATGLPTTVLADPALARIGLVAGFQTAPEMIRRLEAEIAAHRELLDRYQRALAANDPDELRALAARLHASGDGRRAGAIYERLLAGDGPPEGRARLELALADARRLAFDWAGADQALDRARAAARTEGAGKRLAEAMALLEVLVARDRGDCARATEAVEELLARHPKSRASVDAMSALKSLENDPDGGCT